ncbi:spore coat protein U domain-containing protein [Ditylenchus destructor]|nr:spore coat protein U domain-containing protein [Ditylenchus destructor]
MPATCCHRLSAVGRSPTDAASSLHRAMRLACLPCERTRGHHSFHQQGVTTMSITKYAKAARRGRHSSFKTALLLSSLAIGAGLLFSVAQEARAATPAPNTFQVTATITSSCRGVGFQPELRQRDRSAGHRSAAGRLVQPDRQLLQPAAVLGVAERRRERGRRVQLHEPYDEERLRHAGLSAVPDSGRSSVWGDGTASSAPKSGTGTGSAQTIPVYGRIPSLSSVVPGSYPTPSRSPSATDARPRVRVRGRTDRLLEC